MAILPQCGSPRGVKTNPTTRDAKFLRLRSPQLVFFQEHDNVVVF